MLKWQRHFRELRIDVDWGIDYSENGFLAGFGLAVRREREVVVVRRGDIEPIIVDLIDGSGIFIPDCETVLLESVEVQFGILIRGGGSLWPAPEGSLLRHGGSMVFIEGLRLRQSYGGFNLHDVPAILARWLRHGYTVARKDPHCVALVTNGFSRLIEVALESQQHGDTAVAFYNRYADWWRIGNIGVLDAGVEDFYTPQQPHFYEIPGIAEMPRRKAEFVLQSVVRQNLEMRRRESIRGAGLSREQIVEIMVGILAMNEPKSRGFITVQIPQDQSKSAVIGYEDGMRPQRVSARLIVDFIKAGGIRGVAFDGKDPVIRLNLNKGLNLTPIERTYFIGKAMSALRAVGLDQQGQKDAA